MKYFGLQLSVYTIGRENVFKNPVCSYSHISQNLMWNCAAEADREQLQVCHHVLFWVASDSRMSPWKLTTPASSGPDHVLKNVTSRSDGKIQLFVALKINMSGDHSDISGFLVKLKISSIKIKSEEYLCCIQICSDGDFPFYNSVGLVHILRV